MTEAVEQSTSGLQMMLAMLTQRLEQVESGARRAGIVLRTLPTNRLIEIVSDGGICQMVPPAGTQEQRNKLRTKAEREEWSMDRFNKALCKLQDETLQNFKYGDIVLLLQNGAIDGPPEPAYQLHAIGEARLVRRVLDDQRIELDSTGPGAPTHVVYLGPGVTTVQPGHNVICDRTHSIVIADLGKPQPVVSYKADGVPDLTWADVGGLTEVKTFFEEALELPYKHPEIFAKYGYKPPKGVLLSGPPGCGKTYIAKVVANVMRRQRGVADAGFFSVKGPEILAPYVGVAEQRIRDLFKAANNYARETDGIAIIFIDECEAIMSKRGSGRSSDVDKTIVPSFLTEMDGMEETRTFLILATNRPDMLDEAIIRPGRIDQKCQIPRPDRTAAEDIFAIHLRTVPLHTGMTVRELANVAAFELYSEAYPLFKINFVDGTDTTFMLHHIASGAMIANMTQLATSFALRRDLSTQTYGGVRKEDIIAAIQSTREQSATVKHESDIMAFIAPRGEDDVQVIQRV